MKGNEWKTFWACVFGRPRTKTLITFWACVVFESFGGTVGVRCVE